MAQAANIVINDGAGTPVAHTFNPQMVGLDKSLFRDRTIDVIIGQPSIEMTKVEPTSTSGLYRVTTRVSVPVLEVSAPSTGSGYQPQPKVAYTLTGLTQFMIPQRSTLQERKHVLAYVKNLMANATLVSAVENLEMPW